MRGMPGALEKTIESARDAVPNEQTRCAVTQALFLSPGGSKSCVGVDEILGPAPFRRNTGPRDVCSGQGNGGIVRSGGTVGQTMSHDVQKAMQRSRPLQLFRAWVVKLWLRRMCYTHRHVVPARLGRSALQRRK